jgi:hypothetical protein
VVSPQEHAPTCRFHDTVSTISAEAAEHLIAGVTISVFLERVAHPRARTDCREHLQALAQEDGPFHRVNITISGSGQRARLEDVGIPRVKGFEAVKSKHLHGCVAQAEVYADLHLSTVVRHPGETDRFAAILRTVRFEP